MKATATFKQGVLAHLNDENELFAHTYRPFDHDNITLLREDATTFTVQPTDFLLDQ